MRYFWLNSLFNNINGNITVNGRTYSAKEVIRGLLEQGISVTESTEGLKIGFKQFAPLSSSSQEIRQGDDIAECPFIPYMNKVTIYLENIASRFEPNVFQSTSQPKSHLNFSEPNKNNPSSFSPFAASSFQPEMEKNQEKEKIFSSGSTFLDKHRKCSACGAALPKNAFFCNKCGNHARSG